MMPFAIKRNVNKLSQFSKRFSNIFLEKNNLGISVSVQFKPMLFKGEQ